MQVFFILKFIFLEKERFKSCRSTDATIWTNPFVECLYTTTKKTTLIQEMDFDYMIVGAGLAGMHMSLIAFQNGHSVLLVHDPKGHSSSRVAGGIFNPVTGKKLVKTWKADQLWDNFLNHYRDLERLFGQSFVHPRLIYRPITSIQQQNDWSLKLGMSEYDPYLRLSKEQHSDLQHQEYGGIETLQGGYIDVPKMLDAFQTWAKDNITIVSQKLSYEDLKIEQDGVQWKEHKAKQVVFCEGIHAKQNPFFELPFNAVKGEVIEVDLPNFQSSQIINQGVAIVPLVNGHFKVASTYDWAHLDWQTTQEAQAELLDKLHRIIKTDQVQVIDQKAGIRPATITRRPIVGTHPQYSALAILNGLGSKGVTLAPYFAERIFHHLQQDTPDKGLFPF